MAEEGPEGLLYKKDGIASHADFLRLVTRSSPRGGGTRDNPKKVCVGG